jgi:DNA gyrase/topoisomerase IV subunit B
MSSTKKVVYKAMKDQRSHVLLRPDMYIGSVKNVEMEHYGAKRDENGDIKIFQKTGAINPGLHRIFVEVISNAIDNVWRSEGTDTPSTKIKVNVSEDGEISVWNDGLTIHIEINEETGLYNPAMIFGRLLSGSNFNDDEERKTSGRNGLGIKLCSIFSTEFSVDTFDPPSGKKYVQTWRDNMSVEEKAKITSPKPKAGYTLISFKPDYARFGVDKLSSEMLELFFKNVVDIAMITGVSVEYNGEKIPVKNLKDYSLMYAVDGITDSILVSSSDTDGVLTPSSPDVGGWRPISFVNGVENFDGGVNVDTWSEAILRPVLDKINKGVKKGNKPLTIKDIRPYFRMFLNSKLINPSFTSQEKTKLSGPNVEVPEISAKHINAIMKWGVIDEIKDILVSKDLLALKKTEKKRGFKKIEGLDKANLAGSKQSSECSLILCEGDSARTFAVTGISTGVFGKRGRDYFGAYSARGKGLNVRGKSGEIIQKNKEINDLIQILNLRVDADYTTEKDFKTLSYGRLIILCDADVDGCIEGTTPVNLSCGMSKKIKDVSESENCLAWSDGKETQEGITQTNVTRFMDKGMKKCVELLFEDGRKMTLTPDHRLCSLDGEWIEAENSLGKSFKMMGIYPMLDYSEIRSDWQLEVGGNIGSFSTNSREEIDKTLAFCRVLGLLVSDGHISKNYSEIYLGNIIDLNSIIKDLELFCNKYKIYKFEQSSGSFEWRIRIYDICMLMGKKINQPGSFPSFILTPDCPKIIVREFLGGLFGGGGVAPCLTRVSKSRSYRFSGLGFVHSKDSMMMEQLQGLLKLFGVTSSFKNPYKTIIDVDSYLNFADFIGFRHCLSKMQKLSCVQSYFSLYNEVIKQQQAMVKLGRDFIKNENLPIRDALKCSIELYETNNFIIHNSSYPNEGNLKDSSNLCLSGFDDAMTYLKKIDGLKFFITEEDIANGIDGSFPTMNLKVMTIKNIQETQHVYDLSIKDPYHSFIANGIVAHNCHITGLLLNFFHYLFPTLMTRDFLTSMRTPIIRIQHSKMLSTDFYTLKDYKKYQEQNPNKKGDIQYFKGLGTNTRDQVASVFGKKMIEFVTDEHTDENMNKVFNSKMANKRKEWLEHYDPNNALEIVSKDPVQKLSVSDFLNNEMILFSWDDCVRSLPNIMDSFKESHRKIFYTAMSIKKLKYSGKTMKVAQLAGAVSEKTNYHHGEVCLYDTITKMAQDFVGSNNIPLFYRGGQFGSLLDLGKDAANGRYIFTKLDVLTKYLFRSEDDQLLTHIYEEGDKIEPEFFVPILPTILINGCLAGIGTGWSTNIPCYNPLDLVDCVKTWLTQECYKDEFDEKEDNIKVYVFPEISPWYRGFLGTMEKVENNKYITKGIMERKNDNTIIVKALPIGMSTNKFKEFCDDLLEAKSIKGYKNYSTDVKVEFHIQELSDGISCNIENMKLTTSLSTNNMVLFNEKRVIKKYENVDEILENFCKVRYSYYVKRRETIIARIAMEQKLLANKMRFLKEVISGELDIKEVDENILAKTMKEKSFYAHQEDDEDEMDGDDEEKKPPKKNPVTDDGLKKYKYLLSMNVRSFTKQKIEALQKELDKLTQEELKLIKKSTASSMWLMDLEEFEREYKVIYG